GARRAGRRARGRRGAPGLPRRARRVRAQDRARRAHHQAAGRRAAARPAPAPRAAPAAGARQAAAVAMRATLGRLLGRGPVELSVPVPWALLELRREGVVPLEPGGPADGPLRVAVVVPAFRRGSGGHRTIANLVRGLEARGHACSIWVVDDEGRHAGETAERTHETFVEFFGELAAQVHQGLAGWHGADVALATGWQTVAPVLRLGATHARAYLVQDHEPDFYGASAERGWAEETYRQGLHCIAASPWLAGLVRDRYGAGASSFD